MASTASIPAYMSSGVPVLQPAHLEGDASLATEILPGPPSLVSIQQSVLKRDPRKPSMAFSYLPPSDPGSTYSGIVHGTLIGHEPDSSRLKRSRTATGRAQRASARQQNGTTSTVDTPADSEVPVSLNPPVDSESCAMVVDDDSSISRSNSFQNMQEGPSTSTAGRPRRKDKGKGKEVESTSLRIKEEPKIVSLPVPDASATNLGSNDDHCSSCRSFGALVYCDGCPKAFHLWCLDPPMESVDEGDSRWFCPSCMIRKHPPRKPPPSFLSPLIHQLDVSIPTEFQLPEDLRTFFKDVTTGPRGTYIDSSETKQLRLNRHGEQEARDPHRLKDRNGAPILCFRCGTSALPDGLAAAVPSAKRARRSLANSSKTTPSGAWKGIISCDYCNLHWHLDCLDPPLPTLPSFTKKWMCPNHADKILPPKRRIPKQNAPPVEVTRPRQFNNGNIEIINPEPNRTHVVPPVSVDEVLINGRRYRIPERVIVLDFWTKLNKSDHRTEKDLNDVSAMSSPLTSLSSLDDFDERLPPESPGPSHDREDLRAAHLLCSLQGPRFRTVPSNSLLSNGVQRRLVEVGMQTESDAPAQQETTVRQRGKVVKLPKAVGAPKKNATSKSATTNGSARMGKSGDASAPSPVEPPPPTRRKRQVTTTIQRVPSTRELRSRSKNNVESSLTSFSTRSSVKRGEESVDRDVPVAAPPILPSASSGKPRPIQIKVEENESSVFFGDNPILEAGSSSQAPAKPRNKPHTRPEPVKETKEKRGRKRKQRDDELPEFDDREYEATEKVVTKKTRKPRVKKALQTPSRPPPTSPLTPIPPLPSAPYASASAPATPSLKIRLPRMSTVIGVSNGNGNTSTRL